MAESALGEAYVPIRATLDKLDSDLDKARGKVSGALSKISKSVQSVGKIALAGILGGIAAIGAGIVGVANQAIPAASDLNESLNATSVVFGEAAYIVQDFGKKAADSAGLSEAAFNQLGATTGAMLQNFGLDAVDAAENTVLLGQRAADMASIFNTDVDEALTAINAGLRGEADPLERFGVSLSAAAVQAKAMELGLQDANGELSQSALTQARLALLYEQTDSIAGDFVNTSGDLANASRVQAARWENFMAKIGSFALPILNAFQGLFLDIGERVFPLVESAIAPVAEVIQGIATAFTGFIGALLDGTDPLTALSDMVYNLAVSLGMGKVESALLSMQFGDLLTKIQEIGSNIWEMISPVIESITNFVSWKDVLIALGIAIASVVLPVIGSLVVSMLPIIATVGALVGAVALLRNAWESDWGGIRTNLTAWWEETGRPLLDLLRAWLEEKIPIAIETLKSFWVNTLQPAIETVWNWLSTVLIPFLSGTVFPWLKDKLTSALTTLSNFWTNTLKPAIETVWSWLSTVLIPFLRDTLFPWLSEKLTGAITTLSDFWEGTLKPAIETVWNFLNDDIIPLFESLWDLLEVTGGLALEALAGLWENTLKPALDSVWDIIKTDLLPIFESLFGYIADELGPKIEWLSDTVIAGAVTAFTDIKNAIQFVIEKVKALIEKLQNLELPPVFTPGSPTPFEMGLRGINSALEEMNKLIDKNAVMSGGLSMDINPAPAMVGLADDQGGPPGSSVNYNAETTIYTNQDPLRVLRASRHLDKLGAV